MWYCRDLRVKSSQSSCNLLCGHSDRWHFGSGLVCLSDLYVPLTCTLWYFCLNCTSYKHTYLLTDTVKVRCS